MAEQLYYQIPLFIFIILAVYNIYQIKKAENNFAGGPIADSYRWFRNAIIFFALWATLHIYGDIFPLNESQHLFFHYILGHGFLLITMIFVAIAARKTLKFSYSWQENGAKIH